MPLGGHVGLVEEDPPKVVAVGEDLVLIGQVRAAAVDKVDAGQVVLRRDLLRAQVLFHRHREVGAAFDRRVVAHDHAFAPRDPPHACHDPRCGAGAVIEPVGREHADLEKGRAGIKKPRHPFARQDLAPALVPRAGLLATALKRTIGRVLHGCHGRFVSGGVLRKAFGFGRDRRVQDSHHPIAPTSSRPIGRFDASVMM